MWNLLAQGPSTLLYKPTAFTDASSVFADEAKAYDADAYPWATYGYGSHAGSAVSATYEDNILLYDTFGTLAKANMSNVNLRIVMTYDAASGRSPGSSKITTSCVVVQYSQDGGSTWVNVSEFGSGYVIGSLPYARKTIGYPAQYYETSYVYPDLVENIGVKSELSINILPALFTTGLQDLKVRFVLSTISVTSHSASTASIYVYDISAVVS